jgi:RNA polymerase sigma factor (sigma-70 family)
VEPTEDLLRTLAPQVLGALARRFGDFSDAEDAAQEALIAAAASWPEHGRPDNPLGWLIRVGSRRMVDLHRSTHARRVREDLAASWSADPPESAPGRDNTLIVMLMCCDPSLTPSSAIALTLRAVGGLATREIAAAFLVPETTMGQRISRAKERIAASGARFALPDDAHLGERLAAVLRVLYLVFNEGYATSDGPDLARPDLSGEAIRLTRVLRGLRPDDPEVAGLLALMVLTDARRSARTNPDGSLVPLDLQDRSLWDQDLIAQGLEILASVLGRTSTGEYQLQASIAGLHDQARRYEDTDWVRIVALYDRLAALNHNPMTLLNRAVALAMAEGPEAGLAALEPRLGNHHRLHSVRAHLLEMAGDAQGAHREFESAASRTANLRERDYLIEQAARLANSRRL